MRRLAVFNSVSLDGYFTGANGDMSWAHKNDPEWVEFTNSNTKGQSMMLFGRVTYDMMKSFWPTPAAQQSMPQVADKMNGSPKVVFSHTLNEATWENTQLVKDDIVGFVRDLKEQSGPDLILMGSGTIIAQLSAARLVDQYQIVTVPIVLGQGRTMFEGMPDALELERVDSRTFTNGNIVNTYRPKL